MKTFAYTLILLSAGIACFFSQAPIKGQELWRMDRDGIFRRVNPPVITPSCESRTGGLIVPQPSLQEEWTEVPCSPVQATALDPMPGTGSKLPIIGGGKTEHNVKLDPETLAKLKELIGKLQPGPVTITPQLPAETTRQLERTCQGAEILVWLASAVLSLFGLGKLGPWVVLVVRGLLSLRLVQLPPSETIQGAPSSTQVNPSSAGSQAVPSSMPKQGT